MSTQTQVNSFFTPTQISGCQLWLDAADVNGTGASVANGSTISTWTDKSGNGRNASQATVANRPSVGRVNDRTAIVFSGSPVFMILPNITSVPVSIFMIAASTQNSNNTFFASFGVFPNAIYLREQFSPVFFGIDGGSGGQYLTSVRDLNTHIWSFTLPASASGTFAFDGSVVATSGFTLNANTDFVSNSLGTWNQQSANGNIRGGISEIVIYNVALSASMRQQVEGYLAWKWGLQGSLPATHPYKTSPIAPLLNPPTTAPRLLQNSFFLPTQISGCQLWLDASDPNANGVPPANNTAISSWRDKSPNSNSSVVRGTVPIYQTNSFNTQFPSLFFNVSQYFGTFPTYTGTTLAGFLVANPSLANNPATRFISLANASNADWAGSSTTAMIMNSQPSGFYRTERNPLFANYSTPIGTPAITNVIFDGTNCLFFANGILTATNASSGSFNISLYSIGDGVQDNRGGQARGNFCEVIIYTSSLTTSQRQQLEGYLAWKWGLVANLPSNHPYKNQPIVPLLNPPTSLPIVRSAVWLPTQISSCAVWMDAADLSTITAPNGNVTRWNDKITNGTQFATQSSWVSPTLSRQNGLNALRYVASSGTGMTLNMSSTSHRVTGYSYFVAFNGNANTNSRIIHSTDGQRMLVVNNVIFFPTAQSAPTLNANTNTLNVISVIENTVTAIVNLNGTGNAISASLTNPTFTSMTLGIGFTGLNGFDGLVCEYVFYNRALNITERQNVEGYLAWKWGGVGNLPSSHPFKLWPPSP